MVEDGPRYFGPYTSAWAVYQTLDALRRIFPYLTCDREITGHDNRACLYFDIKLCNAPCIAAVNQAEYRATIDRQKIVSTSMKDQDVLAFARDKGGACVQVFLIRQGKLIGREYFVIEGAE